ncbi:MAG: class I SAM-dependent methyltransferase [Atopobiaceae bacterium]|nr:class I SAM-dependent methyltransferase [Atopobiaceae bacterium]
MYDVEQFDEWALNYERDAAAWEAEGRYPFGCRSAVLEKVLELAEPRPGAKVMDLGCGPGVLLDPFAREGCEVYGVDSSRQMLALAERKVPRAHLSLADIRDLPPVGWGRDFSAITCTYAIHHLDDSEKVALIGRLLGLLAPGGAVLVGDVAFESREDLLAMRERVGDEWDDDEIYCVADELAGEIPGLTFHKVCDWAGVVEVRARS